METITNAAKGFFGGGSTTESGTEPISGQTGDTKKGEPYDAGNSGEENVQQSSEPSDTGAPTQTGLGNTATTGPIRPDHETDKTGVTSAHQPGSASTSEKPSSSNEPSGRGAEPSVGADPSSAQQNTQKQQGADRPNEEPGDENEAIKATKKEAAEADKVDTSGPGPRPLEEKAKRGGGDAGGSDDGPQGEGTGEGTGEKYVKSSGMVADGGDFDAANPGAGREADRLLEEKGIHHEAGAIGPPQGREETSNEGGGNGEGKKKNIFSKIKSKIGNKKSD